MENFKTNPQKSKRSSLNLIVIISGAISFTLGFIVLIGWYLNSPNLIQISPTFVPMQYNAALGFLLSGLGLVLLKFKKKKIPSILGFIVLLIGSLTLFEYITGYNFGIDELFMRAYILTKTSNLGRMAPTTAFGFIIIGIGIITNSVVKTKPIMTKEEEICNSKKINSILETASDAIISVNAQGEILTANQAIFVIFGYTPEEVIGKQIEMLIPKKHRKHHVQLAADYAKSGRKKIMGQDRHINGLSKTGDCIPLEIGLNRTVLPNGDVQSVAIIRDISERIKTQDHLNTLIKQLKISNSDLSQFAYIASHDLQEPLRMIVNFNSLLKEEYGTQLDENAVNYIDFSVAAASRMQNLVRGLLKYSVIENTEEERNTFMLKDPLEEALRNLTAPINAVKGEILYDDSLPEICSNHHKIARVFQNLISNALKYRNPDCPPKIQVSAEKKDHFWEIAISDNGIGIKNEYFEHIFIPFKRLHSIQDYPGTGIGLSICQKIIEEIGGSVWVTSKLNKGSTFYFTIPI